MAAVGHRNTIALGTPSQVTSGLSLLLNNHNTFGDFPPQKLRVSGQIKVFSAWDGA